MGSGVRNIRVHIAGCKMPWLGLVHMNERIPVWNVTVHNIMQASVAPASSQRAGYVSDVSQRDSATNSATQTDAEA